MVKNGKLFGKINLFDLLVVLLLIVLAVGIVAKFSVSSQDKAQAVTAIYEIEVKSVKKETVDAFKVGDIVSEKGSGSVIGKITDISFSQAYDIMVTPDGRIVNAPIENRYHLTIRVEAGNGAKDVNGVVTVEKYKILDGKDITFETQRARCQGTVKNLEVLGQ